MLSARSSANDGKRNEVQILQVSKRADLFRRSATPLLVARWRRRTVAQLGSTPRHLASLRRIKGGSRDAFPDHDTATIPATPILQRRGLPQELEELVPIFTSRKGKEKISEASSSGTKSGPATPTGGRLVRHPRPPPGPVRILEKAHTFPPDYRTSRYGPRYDGTPSDSPRTPDAAMPAAHAHNNPFISPSPSPPRVPTPIHDAPGASPARDPSPVEPKPTGVHAPAAKPAPAASVSVSDACSPSPED